MNIKKQGDYVLYKGYAYRFRKGKGGNYPYMTANDVINRKGEIDKLFSIDQLIFKGHE